MMEPLLVRLLYGIAGAIVCLQGYSAIRGLLGITAFFVGAYALASHPAWLPTRPVWLAPLLVLAAGLAIALLVALAWKVGIPMLGAVAAVFLGFHLSAGTPLDPATRLVGLALAALLGALLARFLERVVLSLATAAFGALVMVLAVVAPLDRGWLPARDETATAFRSMLILASWGFLALVGAWIQLRPKEGKEKGA